MMPRTQTDRKHMPHALVARQQMVDLDITGQQSALFTAHAFACVFNRVHALGFGFGRVSC